MKVGDVVYVFDYNHRVYKKDANGRSFGGPIYRGHFVQTVIIGETKQSWIVKRFTSKLKKKPIHPHLGVLTAEQVDDMCWVNIHKYNLIRAIERINDAGLLRKIAERISYKEAS